MASALEKSLKARQGSTQSLASASIKTNTATGGSALAKSIAARSAKSRPTLTTTANIYASDEEKKRQEEKNKGGVLGGVGYVGEKVGLGILQTFEGAFDYIGAGILDLFGADDAAENILENDWVNYSHADEWFNPGEGWRVAGDVAGGVGTSLAGIGVGMAVSAIPGGAVLAPKLALGVMALGAAGSSTKEAYKETGELGLKEFGYGAIMGGVEAATEAISGGLGAGVTKAVKAFTKSAGKAATALTAKSVAKQLVREFGSEAFEEGFSELVSPYAKRLTYDPDAELATPEEIGYAALVGGLSGLVMGGGTIGGTQIMNRVDGGKAVNEGKVTTIMDTAKAFSDYEGEHPTKLSSMEAIRDLYTRLDAQGVRKATELTGEQKRALGELQSLTTSAVFEPAMQKSAISAIEGADVIAQKLNADGQIKIVDGKMQAVTAESLAELQKQGIEVRDITADDIRGGVDVKDGKSVAKAMKENDLLRYIAASDVAGRFMMTAKEVETAARAGTKIRSQAELNNYIEKATPEMKAALGAEFGIADNEWDTLKLQRFNEAAAAYRESGKLEQRRAEIKAKKAQVEEALAKNPAVLNPVSMSEAKRAVYDGVDRPDMKAQKEKASVGEAVGGENADISGLTSTEQGNVSVSADEGFVGEYTKRRYDSKQARLLSELPIEALQNATDSNGAVSFNIIGLGGDKATQQKWIDAGLTYTEDGKVYVDENAVLDERDRRRNASKQAKVDSDIRYSMDITPEIEAAKPAETKPLPLKNDKVEISRGRLLQTRANYQSEKVFYKKDILAALDDIDVVSLTAKERTAIADRLWQGYLQRFESEGYALYTKVMEEHLYDELVGKMGEITDEERDLLKRQIKNTLDRIVAEGKPSVKTKLLEQAAKESNVAYWKNEYKSLVGRNEVLGALMSKAQRMKDLKLGTFANATQLDAEIFKGSIEKLSKINFRGNLNITGTRKIVDDLRKWYVKDNPMLQYADERNPGYYDEGVAEMLETLANGDKGFTVQDLKTLLNVMSYFTNFVETYNKVWRKGKWMDAPNLAESYIDKIRQNANVKVGAVWNRGLRKYVEMFGDPMSLMRRIDLYQDGFFTDMLSDLRDAAVEASVAEMEVRSAYDEFLAKKENNGYIEKASTEKVKYHGAEIPKMHLIGLYMTMKRKHAQEGILYNGFTFKHNDETVRVGGFVGSDVKLKKADIEAKIKAELSNIEQLLSDTDKQYIAILEKGYNADVRKLKVERDMQRLGYTNATEDYYYPIRRANIARNIDVSDIAQEIDRVSNSSFNKDTVKGAKQKLFIESADTLFNRHVHAVCQYASLSPAIETFNVLYNMDIAGNRNDPVSVRTESQNTWDTAEQYFRKLISDVQGIPVTASEGAKVFSAIRGGYAKSVLGANPKVWFTQLSSVFASSSILDADSITKGMAIDSSDMDEYCGLAKLRNYDNSAVMAQGNLDSKLRKAKTKIDKFSDMLMLPIGKVDRFVVGRLFGACQVQVEKNGGAKVGTEANKKAAGKLLQKVILETQQNSIATERSRAMRSGSEFMRTITMFTSDSMKVFGRVIDSVGESTVLRKRVNEATDGKEKAELESQLKEANKRARKSIGALVTTAAFMACIAQMFRWLYDKDKKEDETVAEMMTADFVGNLFGGLPVVKDVYSFMVDGYGIENYTYSSINDLMSSTKSLFEASASIISGEATSQDIARSTRSLAYSVSQVLGIPTRNVYNMLYGLTKRFDHTKAYKIDNIFYEKNYKTDLYKAVENNDGKMVAMLMDVLYGERMGDEMSESVYNELYALTMEGYKVMPKAVRTSFTYNGEEIALDESAQAAIRSTYSTCQPALERLFASSRYRKLTSEQKQEAINYVYDIYYDDALQYVTGISQGKMVTISKAVNAETLALFRIYTKGLESDKDANGKTVSGSKKAKVVNAIKALGVSQTERLLLTAAAGYSLTESEKKRLISYINKLAVTKDEKIAIAEACGFTVKNGRISLK